MSTISPASEEVYELGSPGGPRPRTAAGSGGRFVRLFRGPDGDPRWARPSLLALLAVAAVLYLWDLSASGWANSFYAAAAQAGTKSWKAMLFGSLDAGNAITVDKPPASLWVMEISGRIFGFSSWSMLFPEALMGVATVGVVYAAVKRVLSRAYGASVGAGAGLLAAAGLLVTPVAVLMFKFNNPDALLTLLLTVAVYAVVRAMEHGSTKWLVAAGTLIGFAFLTKTLQAFLILPALTVVYLGAGPGKFVRRLWQIGAAGLAIVVSAGWWIAIVQLTPAADRPYVGGSQHNSFLELTFGYNGLGRLTGNETGSVGGGARGGAPGGQMLNEIVSRAGAAFGGGQLPAGMRRALGGGGGGFAQGKGLLRMFGSEVGGQISWLLPGALLLLVFGLVAAGRAKRTDEPRAALLAWGLSLISTAAVFSFMAGIFHPYYTVALAPLIAATAGIGAGMLWAKRESILARAGLAAAAGATAWWAYVLLGRTSGWNDWMRYAVIVLGVAAAAGLLVGKIGASVSAEKAGESGESVVGIPGWVPGQAFDGGASAGGGLATGEAAAAPGDVNDVGATTSAKPGSTTRIVRWVAVGLGVSAALLGPAGYAVATTKVGHSGSIPSAGPSGQGFGGPGGFGGRGTGNRGFGGPGQFPGFGNQGTTGGSNTGQFPGGGQLPGGAGQFPGGAPGGTGQFPGGTGQLPGGSPSGGTTGTPRGGGMSSLLDASTPGAEIQAMLKANASSYRWVAAAIGAQNAAGYQLATGDPVMAIGGFNGSDPSPTLAQFQQYVAQHKIHYYIAGGVGQANGGADEGSSIGTWVKAHFTAKTVDNVTIYDLTQPTS